VAPVVLVAGEEASPLASTLNDQAVAIVLDFVYPVGTAGHLAAPSGDAGFKGDSAHLASISDVPGNFGTQPGLLEWKVAGERPLLIF
jgi:hypothetical protein